MLPANYQFTVGSLLALLVLVAAFVLYLTGRADPGYLLVLIGMLGLARLV